MKISVSKGQKTDAGGFLNSGSAKNMLEKPF